MKTPPNNQLSKTELKVLNLFQRGYTSKEIGKRVKMSKRTVEIHSQNIQRKLNAVNITHAVALAIYARVLKICVTITMYNKMKLAELTPRNKEVLHYCQQGFALKQLEDKMGIDYETVKTHSKKAKQKLNARNITHAVAIAIHVGVIEDYRRPIV